MSSMDWVLLHKSTWDSRIRKPFHGNNFIRQCFGPNIARRHRRFKCFFTSTDPHIPVPFKNTHPNWEVHPLLNHIKRVSKNAIFLGKDISCGEQTIGFQGHHKDKQRITFKNEDSEFLADVIHSDGCTYSFYFCNQPAPEKYLKQGWSLLHARVLALVEELCNEHGQFVHVVKVM